MCFPEHSVVIIVLVGFGTALSSISDGRETLSSAKMRGYTIPKPTRYFRRSNFAADLTENITNLSNASARRLSFKDVWNWDYWCQLQPKTGNCSENILRYYYDMQLDQCATFVYSGCNGNSNNFDTEANCLRYCNGAAYMPLKDEVPNFCSVQPDAGMCLALNYQYYYDVNNSDCKIFQYGGCGGNRNRFNTKQSCLKECSGS